MPSIELRIKGLIPVCDINQMVIHPRLVIARWFRAPNIEASIDLDRVATDDLTGPPLGKLVGYATLS
jgi:hypothetical protein